MTPSKQLNILHVDRFLEMNVEAAIVVPGNQLFEGRAGALLRKLFHDCNCDIHLFLRPSIGIFYFYALGS